MNVGSLLVCVVVGSLTKCWEFFLEICCCKCIEVQFQNATHHLYSFVCEVILGISTFPAFFEL